MEKSNPGEIPLPDCELVAYHTPLGMMYRGLSEHVLTGDVLENLRGKVQLLFTSPPFALNRKKKYGNKTGNEYIEWLASYAPLFRDLVGPTGSIVLEIGNAWVPGSPTMSTLSMKADNRRVLSKYSASMRKLLARGTYNSGRQNV